MREIVDKSEYSVINDSRSAVSFPIIKILFDCHKVSDILVANNLSYFGRWSYDRFMLDKKKTVYESWSSNLNFCYAGAVFLIVSEQPSRRRSKLRQKQN